MIITDRSHALHIRIFEEDYYINLYRKILEKHGISTIIDQFPLDLSDGEYINLWNDFWNALPDSKEIRRAPFFALCDLAEEIYN